MLRIKIPLHDFALKMQGGLMREGGGAYLRDTTVNAPSPILLQSSACSKGGIFGSLQNVCTYKGYRII